MAHGQKRLCGIFAPLRQADENMANSPLYMWGIRHLQASVPLLLYSQSKRQAYRKQTGILSELKRVVELFLKNISEQHPVSMDDKKAEKQHVTAESEEYNGEQE